MNIIVKEQRYIFVWQDYIFWKNIWQRSREILSLVYSSVHGNRPNMSTPAICDHSSIHKQTIKWVKKYKHHIHYISLTCSKPQITVINSEGAEQMDMWIHFVWIPLLEAVLDAKTSLCTTQFFATEPRTSLPLARSYLFAFWIVISWQQLISHLYWPNSSVSGKMKSDC